MKHTALLFMAALLLASCNHNDRGAGTDAATYIPDAPDYADATMWYTRQNSTADKGADVFYLVSTWETDWTTDDGRVCHYADVHNATHRANMDKEISRIAGYMGEAVRPTQGATDTVVTICNILELSNHNK